MKLKTKASQI